MEGDNQFQVCVETEGDDQEDFFQQLSVNNQEQDDDPEDDDVDGDDNKDDNLKPPSPEVRTFKEAIENISRFL